MSPASAGARTSVGTGVAVAPWVRDWWPVLLLPPVLVLDAIISKAGHSITPVHVVAAIVACLPLALRRRISWALLIPLIVGGVLLVLWQLHPPNTVVLIPLVALYEIALRGDRSRSLWLAAGTIPCVVISVLPFAVGFTHVAAIVGRNILFCFVAIAAGDILRTRAEAERQAVEAREQETLRRLADERLAIAHEIHDVVAHGMTAINVQAGVAAHLLERDPGQVHDALREIKRTSGEALAELRATLSVLRDVEGGAPLRPPGRLDDLEPLAQQLRAAGVSVALDVSELGAVPEAIGHAGYRIVQEALTNVARHSGAEHAAVTVRRTVDAVTLEIADDGHGCDGVTAGNGMRGMTERARALGGSAEAGPGWDGGWVVHVSLPVALSPSSTAPPARSTPPAPPRR